MINFHLEKFEGPLSLLLKLIEDEELDITQVSLAKVADQFVEYIRSCGNINPEETADFLVVAARLILIKSKALLPYMYPEEEEDIREFEEQLKMYQEFLTAAKAVQELIGQKRFMFSRPFNRKVVLQKENFFAPPEGLKAEMLARFYHDLIDRVRPIEQKLTEERLEHKVSIEDKILAIEERLLARTKFIFSEILSKSSTKTEIVVSFLAMLELVRMNQVDAVQNELFGDIEISKLAEELKKL